MSIRCIRFAFVFTILAVAAWAQIGTSTITGRVIDPTGAVVPAVGVTVVQIQTNFTFTATSNNEGLYRVQSLQPGMYRITFEAAGFKRLLRENVELRTGDTLAVDVNLEVGSVSESVEVRAATQLLETETSATGAVVSGKVMYDLPFFQRYVNWSVTLVPGVMTNGNPHPNSPAGWAVAGQRGATTALFEDGVHGNAQVGTAVIKPVLNAVTGCLDGADLEGEATEAMGCFQTSLGLAGLSQRQRRPPRADAYSVWLQIFLRVG